MSTEGLEKIPLALQRRMEGAPGETMYLLLHVTETGPAQIAAIERAGYVVRHETSIIPCYAVSGPARGLQALAGEAWLDRVEEDGTVQTMKQ